jgi:hypothetical protein
MLVVVLAGVIGAAALVSAGVVTAFYYDRLPLRLAWQIGSDGEFIGVGARRNLLIVPALLGFGLVTSVLVAANAVRTMHAAFPRIGELSAGALVGMASVCVLLAANNIVAVRAAVAGRTPSRRRLVWMYRLVITLAFAAIAFLVWIAFDASHVT